MKNISMTQLNEIFGRQDSQGNVGLFFIESGEHVTRLDSEGQICYFIGKTKGDKFVPPLYGVYPVNADVSTKYEHPEGIVITVDDANRLGIEVEQAPKVY